MDLMVSADNEQMDLQRRSTTLSIVWNTSFLKPTFLIPFQICSMGFISGVYGGIKAILMFSGTIKAFALCQAAPSHTRIILSFEYDSDKWLRNTFTQIAIAS